MRAMRILLVSQLYPGPRDPDLGVFVRDLETALVVRGHEVQRAVLDRRGGGKRRYLELARATFARAREFRPDVVYAHFLVPTGLIAALETRVPLVVTAHGRDVRNVVRLARAVERLDGATLTFVGDGPLRREVEGRARVEVVGAVPHAEIPARIAAAHVVCGVSL